MCLYWRQELRTHQLLRFFSAFPAGLPGIGLLLLRLAVGVTTILQGVLYLTSASHLTLQLAGFGSLALATGIMLLIGVLTPAVGIVITLEIASTALSWLPSSAQNLLDGTLQIVFSAIVTLSIVLLGPGAYSIDARLFGRREIIIPPASRLPK